MGVNQHYLFQARQMQALSLAVHIPLVCFGIAFPVLVLFAQWRYLRTGDDLYRTLARCWSRIMLALFAVGVTAGTVESPLRRVAHGGFGERLERAGSNPGTAPRAYSAVATTGASPAACRAGREHGPPGSLAARASLGSGPRPPGKPLQATASPLPRKLFSARKEFTV